MEYLDFNLSKKLKEKGFQEECLCHYVGVDLVYNIESPIANNQLWFCHNKYDNIWHRDNYDAPTISQVLKWFRDEKKIFIEVYMYNNHYLWEIYNTEIVDVDMTQKSEKYSEEEYLTYEDAALAGIEYVLDNLI